MTTLGVLSRLAAGGIVCLILAGVSEATVPRAFVSINGSDLNPCSAVQPCRSFNQALTVVEPGGEIVVQSSGGYSTGFTITQSVTIDAAGFNASVISTSAADLCTINAGPSDRVVLRGISFHGANVGNTAINAAQVGSLYVEHCSIAEFNLDGVEMLNGGSLFVTGTDARKCQTAVLFGTLGATPANLVAHDSRFTECLDGLVLSTVASGTSVTGLVSDCTASLCTNGGFWAESHNASNAVLTLNNCRSFRNAVGIFTDATSTGNAIVIIANCVVTRNLIGIDTTLGGAIGGTSPGTNLIVGNGSGNSPTSSVTLQ
jgi:hypothetical protein